MNARTAPKPGAQRQDGLWIVQTMKGNGGVSPEEIPEGARVLVVDGHVRRAGG